MKRKSISRYKRSVVAPSKRIDMKKEAKIVNRMIRSLKKKHTNVRDISYALQTLVGKLDLTSRKSGVKLIDKRSNMIKIANIVNLKPVSARAFIQALKQFKQSESSTNRGLVRIAKRQRQMLLKMTSNEEFVNSLSDKELIKFHKVFEDEKYEAAMQGLDSDSAYAIMLDVFQYQVSEKDFENMISTYANNEPDLEIRKSMQEIYKKYLMRK